MVRFLGKEDFIDMEATDSKKLFAPEKLRKEVIDGELCPLCGGCVAGCPYLAQYKGGIVQLDRCTLSEGNCYQYCPRTYTDIDALSQKLFGVPFSGDGIGTAKEVLLARSTDPEIQEREKGGGAITALLSAALAEGIIDAAIGTRLSDGKATVGLVARNIVTNMSGDGSPVGLLARSREELLQIAGADYATARVLSTLNSIPKESNEKLGIIGLPCQVASVSKRKLSPPQNRVNMDNVKLVISLFCATKRWLEPGEDRKYINEACSYCWDWTGEFADISVGSGRAKFKDWNIVIVRTKAGAELVDVAKAKGALETQAIPDESLNVEKKASLDKKKRALKNITAKTGDRKDLLYLGLSEAIVNKLLT